MKPKKIQTLKMTALFLALILSLLPLGLASANDRITATLTAADGVFTVGDRIPLNLTVTHPSGYRVLPLQFQDSALGAFEIQEVTPPQVVANPDGTETSTQTIYATLWAPGEFHTPELPLALSDTAGQIREISAAPLSLTVASVLVEGDTEMRDIKPQASLPLPAIWPFVVGGLLVALLVAFVAGWLLRRWWLRRKAALANAPDNRLPHEVAFDELFQIAMLDRTTFEIRRSLKLAPFNQDNKRLLVELLNEADLVKFARVRPETSLAQNYLAQARRFVGETRPPEVVTGNGSGQTPNDGHKTERFDLQHNNTPLMEAK